MWLHFSVLDSKMSSAQNNSAHCSLFLDWEDESPSLVDQSYFEVKDVTV